MSLANNLTIRLHPNDNVVVARADIVAGVALADENLVTAAYLPAGHKVATAKIEQGQPVRKYDQIIGFAGADIAPGEHVHSHNLDYGDFVRDYAFGADVKETPMLAEHERATFQGFRRADGRAATRNYVGVLTSVNCSATVARAVADQFRGPLLEAYPNIDGVVALTHGWGCGMGSPVGAEMVQRAVGGYARHPNFAAVLVIGLGCEGLQISRLLEKEELTPSDTMRTLVIQDQGAAATMRLGVEMVKEMLPAANQAKRVAIPASELILGLECGGSDAYSGISANPALGAASDLLARHGGTACLAETPEIYGAEHLLTRRAVSREVGEKLIELIHWWEDYAKNNGAALNNNPSPGNKAGGLTTILEKSLGAAAKGGTSNLMDVYNYAHTITKKGFVFMDTPGYDPASVTGMVAGGANIVCFTTGRGSVFGCKPVPCLKLATNSTMYNRMSDDMDVNCGTVIDGDKTVQEMGQEIFDKILVTASGEQSKSEIFGMGDNEFVPWAAGATL